MEKIIDVIIGKIVPLAILLAGLYFCISLRFFYLLHPFRTLKRALRGGRESVSALGLALAGTLGVGNVVGVAAAISEGGAGAVFWMWVSAFLAMALKYAEIVLAMKHVRYDGDGNSRGSAMYYIRDCFTQRGQAFFGKILSALFAVLLIITALTMGSILQTSAAAEGINIAFGIPKYIVSLAISVVAALVLMGGGRTVLKVTDRIVPFMTLGFVFLALAALMLRADALPFAFAKIFTEAFSPRAAVGGVLGFVTSEAVRLGVMRGLLSNEAGCGTSPTAHSYSVRSDPSEQGAMGIIEVFVDTVLLCTLTALVIIVSGASEEGGDLMSCTMNAFSVILGQWAGKAIAVAVLFFGGATVVCWTHYGMAGIAYLSVKKRMGIFFGTLYAVCAFLGGIVSGADSLTVVDISLGVMTLINVFVLILSRKEIIETAGGFTKGKGR